MRVVPFLVAVAGSFFLASCGAKTNFLASLRETDPNFLAFLGTRAEPRAEVDWKRLIELRLQVARDTLASRWEKEREDDYQTTGYMRELP